MKTAESSIKSDLGKFLIELAIHKIDSWAQHEFNQARYNTKFPACIQTSAKSWVIGDFKIKQNKGQFWTVTYDDKFVHNFYSKQAAMYYALFERMKLYSNSEKLLKADADLLRTMFDYEFYTAKLGNINRNTDQFKAQLWRSRYLETKSKYRTARQELEKRLISAKYNKVWDQIL